MKGGWYCLPNRWHRIVSAGIVGASKAGSTVGKLERGLNGSIEVQSFSDFLLRAEAGSRSQLFLQKHVPGGPQWKMIMVLSQKDIFNTRKG